MPPWNVHDILLRVTNPPYTDVNGFLQADHEGVINRWDIINTIEHLPWTTKQLYAMRQAKHNSRAKQISAFNGWNNQYGTEPWTYHEYHGIMEEELWRRHLGLWYHPDGRPLIPIRKGLEKVINFGGNVLNKCVAQPIGSLLRRTRSFGALPRHDSGNDTDSPPPVPEKQLRRRATLAELKKEFRKDLYDSHPYQTDPKTMRCSHHNPCDCSHHQAVAGPSHLIPDRHGRHCRCEQCVSALELIRGNYPPPRPKDWDINKPTGADAYSETWDEWHDRIDFNRDFLGLPIETMDLRHRSRNRNPQGVQDNSAGPSRPLPAHTRPVNPSEVINPRPASQERNKAAHTKGVDPLVPHPSNTRHQQARPPRPSDDVPSRRQAFPPAPVVPDHVSSHFTNARLLNDEQKRWAGERADWKTARLQELRRQDGDRRFKSRRGPVDEWRRALNGPQPKDRPNDRPHVSRLEKVAASDHRDAAGRRHRNEPPTTSRPHCPPKHIAPTTSRAPQASRQAGPTAHLAAQPPPSAVPIQTEASRRHRHQSLASDQPYEDEDSDPFDERAYHGAHVTHVYRRAQRAAETAQPPKESIRMTPAERDARIAQLARHRPTTAEERAQNRLELCRFANAEGRVIEPGPLQRGQPTNRTEARADQPEFRKAGTCDPHAEAELRRRGLLGESAGPTGAECGYIYGRLQNHLDAQPRSSHTPAHPPARPRTGPSGHVPPVSQFPTGRQLKPGRDIGLGRPPATRVEKELPSLPSFPPFSSSSDKEGPRAPDRNQPSGRVQGTHIKTPPEDPPVRKGRRGAQRSDQSDVSDGGDSSDNAPRAGDKGWREDWAAAQLRAKKQELKKVLEEYEAQETALARRDRTRR